MNKRLAVMDLGTNTFHLLIADEKGEEIFHREDAVKLGEGGINKGNIEPAPFKRGLEMMKQYQQDISRYNVQQVKAIATSALRNAANGQHFVSQVSADTGINIDVIDGNTEAEYIYKGVKAAGCLSAKNSLILDIGGGSVEFIICNKEQVLWKQSVEVGAARLMDKFHKTDPIPHESIAGLNDYLESSLLDFFIAAKEQDISCLIGSSGAFESFARLIEVHKSNPFDLKNATCYTLEQDALLSVLGTIIKSSHKERAAKRGIIEVRVDMIVVASLITRFIIERLAIKQVIMSTNSLKEGVLAEMMTVN